MPLLDYRMWICNEQQIIGFMQAATSGAEEWDQRLSAKTCIYLSDHLRLALKVSQCP